MKDLDLQAFIDRQPVKGLHLAILMAGVMMMFVDGFDIFMLGKIAPAVAAAFGKRPQAMTQVFVAQQIGLALGAFLITPLADLFGRRRLLMVCASAFGSLTLVSVFAPSLEALAVLRGGAGVFLAGVVPMVIAFVSEIMPAKVRATFVSLTLVGYSLGNAAGGASAAWLLTRYGWTSGFWVGGVISLACVPILFWLTTESLQFFLARDPSDRRIAALLHRIDSSMADRVEIPVVDLNRKMKTGGLLDIWRRPWALRTGLLWLTTSLSIGSVTLLASWLPTFFQQMAGVPIARFGAVSFAAYLCGIPGVFVIGALLDRFNPGYVVALFYAGLALFLCLLGQVPFNSAGFFPVLVAWSLFQTSGQAGLNLLTSRTYPPRVRSTALGWAGGAGRIVSIFTPALGGYAVAQSLALSVTMGTLALSAAVVSILVLLFSRLERKRNAQTLPDRE